jgi:hypothetical protein
MPACCRIAKKAGLATGFFAELALRLGAHCKKRLYLLQALGDYNKSLHHAAAPTRPLLTNKFIRRFAMRASN